MGERRFAENTINFKEFILIFFLQICGVENVATADPNNSFTPTAVDGLYHSDYSYICRYAYPAQRFRRNFGASKF